jgi:HK97 family phage major capsid protein
MNFNPDLMSKLADALAATGVFTLRSQFNEALAAMQKRAHDGNGRSHDFSISKWVRGAAAIQSRPLNEFTRTSDVEYFENSIRQTEDLKRSLSTTTTPGSYLVPTQQAAEVVALLETYGVLRQAKPRIWNMASDKLTIPVQAAGATFEWIGQNTQQSASDVTPSQLALQLFTCRALTAIPNELLFSSSPEVDSFIVDLLAIGAAAAEDAAFFSTTSVTNGPTSLYASSGTTTYITGGGANGANLTYADLTRILYEASKAKATGPFVWFMSPRSFWQRTVGLLDSSSRPLFIPFAAGMSPGIPAKLFGHDVLISPYIPENQTVGSQTTCSYAVLTNPKYIHIGQQSNALQLDVSSDYLFAHNQTAIRAVRMVTFGLAPAAGVCILKGIL